ncbi:MAG: hypothetical protein MI975_09740 [Cytophagales bacterium]|nr:hypothetical protein [Cytophagales bacterium]
MTNYKDHTIVDPMMGQTFFQWVFQSDESSDRFWRAWLEQHPEKYEEVEEV